MLKNRAERLLTSLFLTAKGLGAPVALGVAAAIYDDQGRVLLVRQSYMPGWRLPAGGVARGEAPEAALAREMTEEVGLTGGAFRLASIHSRRAGWFTNVVLLFTVTGGAVNFRPNFEVREILFADPKAPPPGTSPATLRRLLELTGGAPPSPDW